jgi:diguanylate cyclase (GGDEF)-like protein
VRADGSVAWVLLSTSLVRDADGAPTHLISQMEDVTTSKELGGELIRQAFHDPLTGLANRLLVVDRLGHALVRLGRQPGLVAVLFLDLDRFKAINDTYGHDAGDRLLVIIGGRIRSAVRPADTVARIGGDEFVIVCEDITSQAEVVDIAERIKAAITVPCPLNGGEATISASVGVALASGPDELAETLLRDADTAMYRAKEHGKDRHELFTDVMRAWVAERVDAERDLRQAIRDQRLLVLYQPIISLHSNTITGVEALMRYQTPNGELVEPHHFLDVAEESRLIVPVGT